MTEGAGPRGNVDMVYLRFRNTVGEQAERMARASRWRKDWERAGRRDGDHELTAKGHGHTELAKARPS